MTSYADWFPRHSMSLESVGEHVRCYLQDDIYSFEQNQQWQSTPLSRPIKTIHPQKVFPIWTKFII